MPGSGLDRVVVLGDDTNLSRQYFEELFSHPTLIPKFKARVSTSGERWKARAFSKHASVGESLQAVLRGTTNYEVILRDIKALESQGSLAHVANIRFLINANHAAIGKSTAGSLAFMHSKEAPQTPADQLYQPVHRLLVEEHVFAFSWSPVLSKTYYAVMAAIAAAKLASSVASTVASFGATAPGLIDAIGSAAATVSEMVKLASAVKESASILVSGATEAYALGTEAHAMYSASLDPLHAAAATASSSAISSPPATALDLGAHTAVSASGTVSSFFGLITRAETEEETRKRVGRELLEWEGEVQKLNFVVIQHVTPVLQVRDNVDVADPSSPNATFTLKTYMSKRSLVRAGETSRDKFSQMVMGSKTDSFDVPNAAELFCRPWAAEGIYQQWKRDANVSAGAATEAADKDFGVLNWDFADTCWELVDERPGTLPLPQAILNARIRLEERARARVMQKQLIQTNVINSRLHSLAHKAQRVVQERADAAAAAARRVQLVQSSALLTVDEFRQRTTTRSMGGLYVNARNNPKLLMIDLALGNWFKVKQAGGNIEKLQASLAAIEMSCEDYLEEKRVAAAAPKGHESARMPTVIQLKDSVASLRERLAST